MPILKWAKFNPFRDGMDHSLKENQIMCLKAIANGDRRAFERLYSSTSSCLFAIALRMLRNRQWAEEVMVDGLPYGSVPGIMIRQELAYDMAYSHYKESMH